MHMPQFKAGAFCCRKNCQPHSFRSDGNSVTSFGTPQECTVLHVMHSTANSRLAGWSWQRHFSMLLDSAYQKLQHSLLCCSPFPMPGWSSVAVVATVGDSKKHSGSIRAAGSTLQDVDKVSLPFRCILLNIGIAHLDAWSPLQSPMSDCLSRPSFASSMTLRLRQESVAMHSPSCIFFSSPFPSDGPCPICSLFLQLDMKG